MEIRTISRAGMISYNTRGSANGEGILSSKD